jgi:hypothetical protein
LASRDRSKRPHERTEDARQPEAEREGAPAPARGDARKRSRPEPEREWRPLAHVRTDRVDRAALVAQPRLKLGRGGDGSLHPLTPAGLERAVGEAREITLGGAWVSAGFAHPG